MRPLEDGKHVSRLQQWLDEDGQNWGQFETDLDACLSEIRNRRKSFQKDINIAQRAARGQVFEEVLKILKEEAFKKDKSVDFIEKMQGATLAVMYNKIIALKGINNDK